MIRWRDFPIIVTNIMGHCWVCNKKISPGQPYRIQPTGKKAHVGCAECLDDERDMYEIRLRRRLKNVVND